jgi:hypothetical protein
MCLLLFVKNLLNYSGETAVSIPFFANALQEKKASSIDDRLWFGGCRPGNHHYQNRDGEQTNEQYRASIKYLVH